MVSQIASHPRVKRKKKAPGLPGDRIAEIHPNVCAWIERDEPSFGRPIVNIGASCKLLMLRFAGLPAKLIVPCKRLKIATGIDFGQRIAESPVMGMICHFPEPRVSPPVGAMRRAPKPVFQRCPSYR